MDIKKYWICAVIVIIGMVIMAIGNLIYPNFSKCCCIVLIVVLIVIFAKRIFIKNRMEDDKECAKQMTEEELLINLKLAKMVIRANKRQVKIIKTEINSRTNCQLSNERNK